MKLYQLFLASLALSLGVDAAPASSSDDFELRQLTEEDFRGKTAQGLWLVEHFSPKCSHCKSFAPTWTQLAKDKQHLERLAGFHMAQINCLAQGDLCNSNGIKFYPQMNLYSNGSPLPGYSGDRSYADLSKFIDTQSSLYAKDQLVAAQDIESAKSAFGRPNPEGKVVQVDEVMLDTLLGNGPVLVEFFAPWCAHCKKMKPVYDRLAESLQNKINIVAVDCDAHNALCRKQGIPGYPTIRLFHHGTKVDHNGPRTVNAMRKFAMKAVDAPSLQPIKVDDFDDIVKNEDTFFLYLQNFDTAVADLDAVKSALDPLLGQVPAYTSVDPLLYSNLSIAKPPPTSVLLAFSSHSRTPVGSLSFPTEKDRLQRFVKVHRYPTMVQLTSSNYNEFMKSDSRAIVVLGAVHQGEEGVKEKEKFELIAKAWKRGGRGFVQPVWFVWVDGQRWSGWLKQSYGIQKKELPAVVVVDPPLSEYYDMTIEGNQLTFDGHSVFSVLEGVYQHFLLPKVSETTLEWGSRSATMTLINLSHYGADHPLWALVTVVGSVAVFVYLLQRCLPRDLREGRDHHGGLRLD